jgi:hypothetical protein
VDSFPVDLSAYEDLQVAVVCVRRSGGRSFSESHS